MIAEAISKILTLAQKNIIFEGNRAFDSTTLKPILAPVPEKLLISSLRGVVDFIGFEFAKEEQAGLALLVDAISVSVVSRLIKPEQQRSTYLTSIRDEVKHHFDSWMPVVDTIVWLQRGFAATDDRALLLELLRNIKAEETVENKDDGMHQSVVVSKGLVLANRETIKNPLFLTPYLTFNEVEQPAVPCTIRVRSSGATFEVKINMADGGAWRITAQERIAAWLHQYLPEIPVIA